MIKIHFEKDATLNPPIQTMLDSHQLDHQVFSSKDIDTKTLMEWLFRSIWIYLELLSTKTWKHKPNTHLITLLVNHLLERF